MSITDDLRERLAIAERENVELWERINAEPRPATNEEMSQAIHCEAEWDIGPPRLPGLYLIEFYDGSVTVCWAYSGRLIDEHGDEIEKLPAYHYRVPDRKTEVRDGV